MTIESPKSEQASRDPRMQQITEVLYRHGHYLDPESSQGPDVIEWMISDARRVLRGPLTYEGIDTALLDTGIHNHEDCNDACVRDLMEVLCA
jgi:hypothetical protein